MSSAAGSSSLSILSSSYWKKALRCFRSTQMFTFAALIVALRVAVKPFSIPLAAGLSLSFDCYVNALGSLVYGPLMALLVGAVSDTLGALLFPSGAYFFPFILTEMSSSFIFALFLWERPVSVNRTLLAKFSINVICNMILTSVVMKWYYYVMFGVDKAEAYAIINLVRIGKNLVLFSLEAVLITLILGTAVPILQRVGFRSVRLGNYKLQKKHFWQIGVLLVISIALVLLYIYWGADFIKLHNFKWL